MTTITTLPIYRHKKFDLMAARRLDELQIKQELLARSHPAEEEEEEVKLEEFDSSSICSSDYSLPLAKRRRLNSNICDISTESESASSSHSLPNSISPEALRDICKYHGNMVRKFPKKERTPKDQERRNKNTIACRMSRRVKKLENLAVEEQYKEFSAQHLKIIEQSMRATAYFHHINQLIKPEPSTSSAAQSPAVKQKNFSIDYLMNGVKREKC